MNDQMQQFARNALKDGLARLPESHHRTFKLLYARDSGRRSVEDALVMPINDVVDGIPANNLDWAMTQVEIKLAEIAASLKVEVKTQ